MRFFLVISHHKLFIPSVYLPRINPEANLQEIAEAGTEDMVDWPAVPRIKAEIHQAVLNLNRARNNIHPFTKKPYPARVSIFPEEDFSGIPIFRKGEGLTGPEKEKLLKRYYDPFYQQIQSYIDNGDFDFFIDCHLMNSGRSGYTDLDTDNGPDICLGNLGDGNGRRRKDRGYIAFDSAVLQNVQSRLISRGYNCMLNSPFSGGYIIQKFGKTFPCFLLEVNKRLLMRTDEGGILKNKLPGLSKDLYDVFTGITGI